MGVRDTYREIRTTPAADFLLEVGQGADPDAVLRDMGDQSASEVRRDLKAHGLIATINRLAAPTRLTRQGDVLAQYVQQARQRGGEERVEAIRRGLLDYLANNPYASADIDYLEDDPEALGVPIEADEFQDEVQWLLEHKLIRGQGTLQGPTVRPEVQPQARRLLTVPDQTIEDQLYGRGTVNQDNRRWETTVGTNQGNVSAGDHNLLTVNITQAQQDSLLEKLSELEASEEVTSTPELALAVQDIRGAVEAGDTKEGVLAKVAQAFGTAAATSAGQAFITGLSQLPQIMG